MTYIREFQLNRGIPPSEAYTTTMYVLVGFLVVGLICNFAVQPLGDEMFAITSPTGGVNQEAQRSSPPFENVSDQRWVQLLSRGPWLPFRSDGGC